VIESVDYVRLSRYGIYEDDLFRFYVYDQLTWNMSMVIDELDPSIYLQLAIL
jgi:hypothetical protein